MKSYNITITQRAFSDITECVLFINNISAESARKLYEDIVSSISSLKTFPNAYPEVEGLIIRKAKIRRMPIHHGRYLLLYKVEDDLITIYDVIDSRRDNSILKM